MNERKKFLALLLLVVFSATLLRGTALTNRELAVDEGFTISFIQKPYAKMMQSFQTTEAHPPLYPFFAKTTLLLFGSIYWVRVSSALLGVGSVLLSFFVAREFFGKRTGLFTAVLVAFNPLCVFYSQQVRSYSLLIFMFLLLAFLLLKFKENPKTKYGIAIGVLNALIIYNHYHGAVIMTSEVLILGFLWKTKKITLRQGLIPVLLGSLLFLPWVPVLLTQLGFVNSAAYGGTLTDLVYIPYKFAVGANISFLLKSQPFLLALFPLLSVLFFAGFIFLFKEKKYFFLSFPLLPLLVSILFAFLVPLMLHFRHLSYTIPFYLMLAAYSLNKMHNKKIAFLLLALIIAMWAGIITLYYSVVSLTNWNNLIGL